jgi:hypothetical protein
MSVSAVESGIVVLSQAHSLVNDVSKFIPQPISKKDLK